MKSNSNVILFQPIVDIGKSLRIQKSPTGIQAVAAYLKSKNYNVKMIHDIVNDATISKVIKSNPTHIGVSAMTANFHKAKEFAYLIKKHLPDAIITLGGWHVSGCAKSFSENYEKETMIEILNKESPFDYIIIGEGEISYFELVNRLDKNLPVNDIPGIGYLSDEKIIINPSERIEDLDSLPIPIWDGLDINKYKDLRTGFMDLSIHVQRGCRFNCSYCATPNLCPGEPRRLSVKKTIEYLKYIVENFKPTIITFTDEDFLSNLEWLEELCDKIISSGLNKITKYDTFASLYDIIVADQKGLLKKMK